MPWVADVESMATEACAVCESVQAFADTVHVLVHTNTDAGVVDHYVCRQCYEEHLAPVLPDAVDEE